MRASKGERKIYNILVANNIPFIEEYEFADLISTSGRRLRFDFAIFNDKKELQFLIEYQGKQHYQPVPCFGGDKSIQKQRYNDALKRAYCIKHNIKIIYIPYWDEDKISYEYLKEAAGC